MLVYGILNTSTFQEYLKDILVEELKNRLQTEVSIGSLHIQPFNSIELDSVYLYGQDDEEILIADKIQANVDILHILQRKLVITSAQISDFKVSLSKATSDSTLNIQYIIDAFKPQNEDSGTKLHIKLNTISIANGSFEYNILDQLVKENGFDANHISIKEFNSKFRIGSLRPDSMNIEVKALSFKEQSGFEVDNFRTRVTTQDSIVNFRGLKIHLPNSVLEAETLSLNISEAGSNEEILKNSVVDFKMASSYITPKDISAFVPQLESFESPISLDMHILGSSKNLEVQELNIYYGDKSILSIIGHAKNIFKSEDAYVEGRINRLESTDMEVREIMNNLSPKSKILPYLDNVGNIHIEGHIAGYLKKMIAKVDLTTDRGKVSVDATIGKDLSKNKSFYADGNLSVKELEVGKVLNENDLGNVSLDVDLLYEKSPKGKMRAVVKGYISDIQYKGYSYKAVELDAEYDGTAIGGEIKIDDELGYLYLGALYDMKNKDKPELHLRARVDNLHLDDLYLTDKYGNSYLSFGLQADITGKNIENATGNIRIDTLYFQRDNLSYTLNEFELDMSDIEGKKNLQLRSDVVNGRVFGDYAIPSLNGGLQKMLSKYLPTLSYDSPSKVDYKNDLTLDLRIENTQQISDILKLPVTILIPATISGKYNDADGIFDLKIEAPALHGAGMNIKDASILAYTHNDSIKSVISAQILGKKDNVNDVTISSGVADNVINTNINLVSNGVQKAKGKFFVATTLSREKNESLQVDVDILPGSLLLNNILWEVNKAHFKINDGEFSVHGFSMQNVDNAQAIHVDGKYSPRNSNDLLAVNLKKIDLDYVFATLAIDALKFGGRTTGDLQMSSVEGQPYAIANLNVEDFSFHGRKLGNLELFSNLDEKTKIVNLKGRVASPENKYTVISGIMDPVKQLLDLNFEADSIDIGFLHHYAQSVFSKVEGRGTGNVRLWGDFSNVTVEGTAFIENGAVGIGFLNTDYTFSDTIHMKEDLIYFNDIAFLDKYNNKAVGSGKVVHDFFQNFMYNIDLTASNFMVYNSTEKQNQVFFGQVFGTGKANIGGDESAVDVNVSMRTNDKTVVRMNFMENEVNKYSFITFKQDDRIKDDSLNIANVFELKPIAMKSAMDVNMDFYIDATPDAVVELVMDPVGGDIMRGIGQGAIQFSWSNKSSPRLYGTYVINRGNYNFTFQKILERHFTIQNGSTLQFRGDPFEAMLDVSALYKVTANLNDLDKNLAEITGQTNIPVNCVLNLTGSLRHPSVELDILFPNADQEVERQIKSLINTEDMINRQVAYLLLLSKFYTPHYANVEHRTSDFAAVASATLSSQLSKIVSRIDDRWQLGTNIRTSDGDFNNTEVELLLSSQLLNDRLLINGNFGYRDDNLNDQSALIGDVDIEFLLNNLGSWRIKAYNHYNEKYYYKQTAVQTQGVGIMYRKDFDDLYELFGTRRRKRKPKEPDVVFPDSLATGSSLSSFIKMKE